MAAVISAEFAGHAGFSGGHFSGGMRSGLGASRGFSRAPLLATQLLARPHREPGTRLPRSWL